MNDWSVYLLLCADGTLYTGITNNISKRLATHNNRKGAKYTRGRTPVRLIRSLTGLNKSQALRLEIRIKKLPSREKVDCDWVKLLENTMAMV